MLQILCLALNGLFKRNAATFVFDLGNTALNIHEIWSRLLRGEHIRYIRAKMTIFFNIRWLTGIMACLIKRCES